MAIEEKTPVWFWIIGLLALAWNALGVLAYFGQMLRTEEDFAQLTQVEQDLFANQPFWYTSAFAIAVFAGFVAAVVLLLRKRVAVRIFWVSLIAVLVQFAGYFILDGYLDYINGQGWIMPISIPVVAALLVVYARKMEQRGILT